MATTAVADAVTALGRHEALRQAPFAAAFGEAPPRRAPATARARKERATVCCREVGLREGAARVPKCFKAAQKHKADLETMVLNIDPAVLTRAAAVPAFATAPSSLARRRTRRARATSWSSSFAASGLRDAALCGGDDRPASLRRAIRRPRRRKRDCTLAGSGRATSSPSARAAADARRRPLAESAVDATALLAVGLPCGARPAADVRACGARAEAAVAAGGSVHVFSARAARRSSSNGSRR